MSAPQKGGVASYFFASDTPLREVEAYEAVPSQVRYQCGKCGVWMNHDFEAENTAYCMNHHLNRRPESVKIVWSGQK